MSNLTESRYPVGWKPWCFKGLAPENKYLNVGREDCECVGCPWMDDCKEEATKDE